MNLAYRTRLARTVLLAFGTILLCALAPRVAAAQARVTATEQDVVIAAGFPRSEDGGRVLRVPVGLVVFDTPRLS